MSEHGIYFVTAGTLHKQRLFDTPAKLDLVERMLLSLAKNRVWQLEAWAVLVNHYHFVARGAPDSAPMRISAGTALALGHRAQPHGWCRGRVVGTTFATRG